MKDRIRKIMTEKNLTQQSFSNLTGISTATLSNIFNGKTKPTLAHVEAIKRTFPTINTDWLLYGTLPEFNDGAAASTSAASLQPSSGSLFPTDDVQTTDSASSEAGGGVGSFSADSSPSRPTSEYQQPDLFGSNVLPKPQRNVVQTEIKYVDKQPRKITEIRIFYDDQTWETFVPKK